MTKRFVLLSAAALLCLIFTANPAQAQPQFGAKAGFSFADQVFTYYVPNLERDTDWRMGVAFGAFVEKSVVPHVGVRFEALYIQKGYQEEIKLMSEIGDQLGTETFHTRLNMLSLSLLARGVLGSGTYAMVGPRLDFKLSVDDDFPDASVPLWLEDQYASTLAGLTFGAGQEFKVPNFGAIFIEGQYYFDIGKFYDHGVLGVDELATLKTIENRSFAFFAGVRF